MIKFIIHLLAKDNYDLIFRTKSSNHIDYINQKVKLISKY
jgi:hypothetical protein